MEIIDVDFDFQQFEKLIENRTVNCDKVCNHLESLMYLTDDLYDFDPNTKFYREVADIVAQEIGETNEVLKSEAKKVEDAMNTYIALIQTQISHIEKNKTEDEILSNYKVRTKRHELRTKIAKYTKLKDYFKKSVSDLIAQVDEVVSKKDLNDEYDDEDIDDYDDEYGVE